MRLFYASFLDPENMSAYESLVARLQAEVPRALRPIPARTHHLTLAFLGEITDGDVDKCLEVLDSATGTAASSFSLGRPKILYGRGQPRLICADLVEGGEHVAALQEVLRVELLQQLPSLVVRPKPPHVTLARFDRRANRQTARRVEEALARQKDPEQTRTDRLVSVHLVKSSLTPNGPVYESLGEVALSSD
ncbi:MAG: RNA 2',3'-cyclic phosphodiesterase [Thermoanaerobaculia bacterium]